MRMLTGLAGGQCHDDCLSVRIMHGSRLDGSHRLPHHVEQTCLCAAALRDKRVLQQLRRARPPRVVLDETGADEGMKQRRVAIWIRQRRRIAHRDFQRSA